jgi:PAS domain S-box-containing protein
MQDEIINHLTAVSDNVNQNIETFIYSQRNKIELIANQNELSNEELADMVKIDNSFYDLFVINSTGVVVASSNPARIGLDRSNRSYFYNAINTTYISPVYFALVPQQYSLAVSTPFHGGVLVGAIKLEILNNLIDSYIGLGQTGENLLGFKNEKNQVVYFSKRRFSNISWETMDLQLIMDRPIAKAISAEENIFLNAPDYIGEKVIAVTDYIEDLNIGLVTKISISEAFAQVNNLQKILSYSFFVFLLLTVFFIRFISLQISRPLAKLSKNVNDITQGNFDVILDKSSIFEIQDLINSLNRILASMKLAILRTGISKSELGLGEVLKAKEESENKYKLLYQNSADAIMILEPPAWKFTAGNPAAISIFNCKDENDFISHNPGELSPEKQPDGQLSSVKAKKMIEKALKEGSNYFDWVHKKSTGENFEATVLLSKIYLNGKEALQATVRDISKIKKMEEELNILKGKTKARDILGNHSKFSAERRNSK